MNKKRIPLEGAFNFRDLGGYPTKDNKSTKWGMLYRSDELSSLTASDWEIVNSLNVKTIIDLRSNMESEHNIITPPKDIEYYHYSLMPELDNLQKNLSDPTQIAGVIAKSMKLDYCKTLFENIPCCVEILSTVSERLDVGSVIILCSAGKDRTGITAALILYLCGVYREDIIADYAVSSIYNSNGINKKMEKIPAELLKMIPDPEMLKVAMESRPETIIELLDKMDAEDIRKILDGGGFSITKQQQLKEMFTI